MYIGVEKNIVAKVGDEDELRRRVALGLRD
jgi:hypothetical protein